MIGFSGSNLAQNNDNAVGQANFSTITTEGIQKKATACIATRWLFD
jgi:hypothetical protein